MRHSTRRYICRSAFLLVCILPTLCLLAWIAYRSSPIHAASEVRFWERALFQGLGLLCTIERVVTAGTDVATLERIELLDPETNQRVARIRVLEFTRTPRGQVVLVSQPEIEPGQFVRLCQLLHDRVLRGPPLKTPVQLLSGEITLLGERAQTFTNVRCNVESQATRVQALIDFNLAGLESEAASQLQLIRNRDLAPPATGWQLRTGPTPLPCAVFSSYLPGLESLGSSCRFSGTVWVDGSAKGWSGEAVGRLSDVDLGLLMENLPYKLSGSAEMVFQQVRFDRGQLVDAAGTIRAGAGVISTGLIDSLGNSLHWETSLAASKDGATLVPFQQLGLGYRISESELRVSGICRSAPVGTILVGSSGPLLGEPPVAKVPVVSLIRAVSPSNEFLVPATKETHLLVAALPLPIGSPPKTRPSRKSRVPLRLRSE